MAVFLAPGVIFAQGFDWMQQQDEQPSAEVRFEPDKMTIDADSPGKINITVIVPEDHHAYIDRGKEGVLLPVEADFSALERAGIRVVQISKPEGVWDDKAEATTFRDNGIFEYRAEPTPAAEIGETEYTINLRVQICNDITGTCYFPDNYSHTITVEVAGVPDGPVEPITDPKEPSTNYDEVEDDIENAIAELPDYRPRTVVPERGIIGWISLAFLAGMILNVMPCVLPLISIRAMGLMQQAGQSRGRLFILGIAFALGMLAVFLALALVAVLFGLGWGEQFQSPTFRVVMISIVFLFGLALFGLFDIGLPSGVSNLGAGSKMEGFGGTFWMGVLATILATPCSGPFLGATLAWALAQPPLIIFLVFGMMGVGMATPHVAISAYPGLMKIIPKPGAWMETFKHVTGFILMALVIYLMISVEQHQMLFVMAFLFFLAFAAWLWGVLSRKSRSMRGKFVAIILTIAIIVGGAYFSFGTLNSLYGPVGLEKAKAQYEEFDPVRMREYHEQGRNVFLKFTADWCMNCKLNETRVYNSEQFQSLLKEKNVVAMSADLTHQNRRAEIARELMEKLGARAIPFMAVFPGDSPDEPYTLFDLVDRENVAEILEALPE